MILRQFWDILDDLYGMWNVLFHEYLYFVVPKTNPYDSASVGCSAKGNMSLLRQELAQTWNEPPLTQCKLELQGPWPCRQGRSGAHFFWQQSSSESQRPPDLSAQLLLPHSSIPAMKLWFFINMWQVPGFGTWALIIFITIAFPLFTQPLDEDCHFHFPERWIHKVL